MMRLITHQQHTAFGLRAIQRSCEVSTPLRLKSQSSTFGMKITRRELVGLVMGFSIASTSCLVMSLTQKKYLEIDLQRSLPFFVGWYDRIENIDVSSKVYPKGMRLIMPYVAKDVKPETIRAFLDRAKQVGMKVLLEIYRPLVESENISGVRNFIRTYKNHPAVYGWYLYDEPEVKKLIPLSPQLLIGLYQVIKQEDRSKPVAIVFADTRKISPYIDALDILMWDWYPCHENEPEFDWVSGYRQDLYKVISLASTNNKKFYSVLQAYSDKTLKLSLPTQAEIRYMFYLSVCSGVDGILFYMHYLSTNSWNESSLYPMIKEFAKYIPAVIKGKNISGALKINSSDIQIKLFSIPNTKKYVTIAVNHSPIETNLTVNFDRRLAGKQVIANRSKITQLPNRQGFRTLLKPYEVLVCEIG